MSLPEQLNVTPDEAKNLVNAGAYILCLDVPQNIEFGVDYRAFRTGPLFQGVKMIPPGLHFVFYSTGEHSLRQGFFLKLNAGEVLVRRWDPQEEDFKPHSSSPLPDGRPGYLAGGMMPVDYERLAAAVRGYQFDSRLGPYPLEDLFAWRELSSCVSLTVLQRCGVELGMKLLPGDSEEVSTGGGVRPTRQQGVTESPQNVVPFFSNLPRTVQFTSWALKAQESCGVRPLSAADITALHRDMSDKLEHLLTEVYKGSYGELLGELQLAFVTFLLLSSLPSLQQWKVMIHVLCNSDEAVLRHPQLYLGFFQVVQAQLKQVTDDFFRDELSQENFLRQCFSSLYEILDSSNAEASQTLNPRLKKTAAGFSRFLKDRFDLEVTGFTAALLGRGDYENAPVIVSMGEAQAAFSAGEAGSTQDSGEDLLNEMIARGLITKLRTDSAR